MIGQSYPSGLQTIDYFAENLPHFRRFISYTNRIHKRIISDIVRIGSISPYPIFTSWKFCLWLIGVIGTSIESMVSTLIAY